MSASHNELDSIKILIKEKWWKSDENFTLSKFSFAEKKEFIRRKRRWIQEHMKRATENQKKNGELLENKIQMEKDGLVHKGSKVEKLSKKFNARAMKFYDDTLTDFSFL